MVPILALFSIFLLYLNHLMPFMAGDDFRYHLKFEDGTWLGTQRIQSAADFFQSQVNHYTSFNARIFPHFILQLVFLLPKFVFDLINTAVFILIARKVVILAGISTKRWMFTTLIALFLWVFHLDLGYSYFWKPGAMNYAWMLLIQLYFIGEVIEHIRGNGSQSVPVLILAVLTATTNENVVLSLALVLFGFLFYEGVIRKRAMSKPLVWALIILVGGGLVMSLSPAMATRLAVEGGGYDSLWNRLSEYGKRQVYYAIRYVPCLFLFPWVLRWKDRIKSQHWILITLMVMSNIVMVIPPLFEPRNAVFGFVLSAVFILGLSEEKDRGRSYYKYLFAGLALVAVVLAVFRVPGFAEMDKRFRTNQVIMEDSSKEALLIRFCPKAGNRVPACDDITFDPRAEANQSVSRYYGLEAVRLDPSRVVDKSLEWDRFEKIIMAGGLPDSMDMSRPVSEELSEGLVYEKVYAKRVGQNGIHLIVEIAGVVPDDLILITRAARKGLTGDLFLRWLPDGLEHYFLQRHDFHGPPVFKDGRSYFYNFIEDPEKAAYFIFGLYDVANHTVVGKCVETMINDQ